jgi:sterol desaturase/sphingolipid hydroxylase (fatty acid hydroxylase superfamily)
MPLTLAFESWAALAAALHLRQIGSGVLLAAEVFVALFLIIYLLEWKQGADRSHYKSRAFLNDVAYTLFYRGGFYSVFILSAVTSAFAPNLEFMRLNLVNYLPAGVAYVCWWLTFDFFGYWMHRWQHRSSFLWAFHSVHHAPESMTFLTSYRLHVVEQLIANVVMYTPALLLGMPPAAWLPIYLLQTFFESIQHSALNWRFGPLYRVVVSPTFHAFHHSVERRHYDRNYGKVLSVWDFLFGTAVDGPRPTQYGIDTIRIPEKLSTQFMAPFQMLAGRASTLEREPRPATEDPPRAGEVVFREATKSVGVQD